jgi:hypothetical protein
MFLSPVLMVVRELVVVVEPVDTLSRFASPRGNRRKVFLVESPDKFRLFGFPGQRFMVCGCGAGTVSKHLSLNGLSICRCLRDNNSGGYGGFKFQALRFWEGCVRFVFGAIVGMDGIVQRKKMLI